MKKCLVCQRPIYEVEKICPACESFFRWKYKSNYGKKIKQLCEFLNESSESTKSNRRSKNG